MSKQTNFKKLFIILGILLVLLFILKLKDIRQGDRSFRAYVIKVDTVKVNTISIVPKGGSDKVMLTKEGSIWMMDINGKKVQANGQNINDLLGQVSALKTRNIAATTKDKWSAYELTDSSGTRITLSQGKNKLSDFMLGKFSYSQPKGQNPYMQQQNVQMTSYVRVYDEDEVYAVDGYLSMMFNRQAIGFRDNAVLVGNPENWTKLVFNYQADSSFTLLKQNNKWMLDGIIADSVAVSTYFSKIRSLSDNNFDDETQIANTQPEFSVRVEGDNITPIQVKAFRNTSNELVYSSSINKGNLIKSDRVLKTLFVSKEKFFVP